MAVALQNASVLLTGASSGIGAATAVALARRGARLGLLARRQHRLAAVAAECSSAGAPEVRLWPCDLSDLSGAERAASEADEHFGGLDVLLNNAGTPMRRRVVDLSVAELERTMAVNYLAPVRMTLTVLAGMLERGHGSIVNVTSVGGRIPITGEAAYCGSKAALSAFTETLAVELEGQPVDVRLILPGPIDTEIWDRPGQDPAFYDGDLEPPSVVADGIVAAIEGDRIEHYLPDLSSVAEMKCADVDGFIAAMAAQSRGGTGTTR